MFCLDADECRGVMALCLEDGKIHRFRAHKTVIATGVRHCHLPHLRAEWGQTTGGGEKTNSARRDMDAPIFRLLLPTPALETETVW